MSPIDDVVVQGMWYSGSSLLVELLSRHKELKAIPGHLNDFRAPGGILDMVQGLHSDPNYLPTFRVHSGFPRKVARLAFHGSSKSGRQALRRERLLAEFQERFSLIHDPEERREAAQAWWSSLKAIYGARDGAALVDGLIYWSQFHHSNFALLQLTKTFVVIREPADHIAGVARKDLYLYLREPLNRVRRRSKGDAFNYVASRIQTFYQDLIASVDSFPQDEIFIIKFESLIRNPEKYIEFFDSALGTQELNSQIDSLSDMVRKSTGNVGIGKDLNLQSEIPNFSRLQELHNQVISCSAYISL